MKRVLIVDDEPDVLEILEQILAASGYQIIPRPDAESALEVIKGGEPVDIVITDNMLPGMKGAELADAVRRLAPSLPVIMLTAHGSVGSYIDSRSRGVFEYVTKPVQAKELRHIVKAALDNGN
ncbi:MAG: response regulator [Nitrospiraceae bacterium]|nr:response regulator [Nitrospiraceae bacterium]